MLAFIKDKQVWTAPLDGKGKAERLFFDRGADGSLAWSPDGSALAFVSNRGDHAFIGVYFGKASPITYLAPSTSKDTSPRWSAGRDALSAFIRRPGDGGPPEPFLTEIPQPWSIWTADVKSGGGAAAWRGPKTLQASYPDDLEDGADLFWAAGDRLVFRAELDGWPHLYSVPAAGGEAKLLTPGPFMVEHARLSADRGFVVYDANTGAARDDGERRHIFRVAVVGGAPAVLTTGVGIEDQPAPAAGDSVAFIAAGARRPPSCTGGLPGPPRRLRPPDPRRRRDAGRLPGRRPHHAQGSDLHRRRRDHRSRPALPGGRGPGSAGGDLRARRPAAPDAARLALHGLLQQRLCGESVSGRPRLHRTVGQLSPGHRLWPGLPASGQGRRPPCCAWNTRDGAWWPGARFLASAPGVDGTRIGIWGGSYGGYLTALALARNSDVFKAGVDLHGVHDWWSEAVRESGPLPDRYERGDRDEAKIVAWTSSPDADIARWRSPVLLIHGDDDRNVNFRQTVDLARRLEAAERSPFEELVLPNEIHGFLRHESLAEGG